MSDVLIVDDNVDTGRMMSRLLGRLGYASECALTGEEALGRLDRGPLPRLVILDQMMPGIEGLEVLRRIRGDARTAAVPVVMFSAIADPVFGEHALSKGANAHWAKGNIDYSKLGVMVEELIRA
jgi:CheY-like chemotaxis protein